MNHNDNGPSPSRNYQEAADFTFYRKVFFGQTSVFFPKQHPKLAKRLILILEKGPFCLYNFSWSWPEHGWCKEVDVFLGLKSRFSAKKYAFRPTTPNFFNGPLQLVYRHNLPASSSVRICVAKKIYRPRMIV